MKSRFGYVSNSSSSSFLVACDDMDVFGFLALDRGYDAFMRDMTENGDDKRIWEFLRDEFEHIIIRYSRYTDKSGFWKGVYNADPSLQFEKIMRDLNVNDQNALDLIKKGKAMAETAMDYDNLDELSARFADAVLRDAKDKWKILAVLHYSDDDGYFGDYMEHEFMYNRVGSGCSGHNYALVIRNEH